jgi:PAS domain S-box-containing protein
MTATAKSQAKVLLGEPAFGPGTEERSPLAKVLRSFDYVLLGPAGTGSAVLEMAARTAPDLVLMDVQLCGPPDAVLTATQLRERWQIPTVFVTRHPATDTLANTRLAGPFGYVTRPVQPDELQATLSAALDQSRRQRELFSDRSWLSCLLSCISDGLIATDAAGCVRILNPTAQSLTGWSQEDAHGKSIEDVYRLENFEAEPVAECQLRKALHTGRPAPRDRFLLRTRKGFTLPIEDTASPILSDGKILGAVTVFLDLSDRLAQEHDDLNRRAHLQETIDITAQALGQTRSDLQSLTGHLVESEETERRRLGESLQRDIAEKVALLRMKVDLLLLKNTSFAEHRAQLVWLQADLEKLQETASRISVDLYAGIMEDLGLPSAVRQLAEQYREAGGEIATSFQQIIRPLPHNLALSAYRAVQYALGYFQQLKPIPNLHVQLEHTETELRLSIADRSSDSGAAPSTAVGGSLQLLALQERIRLAGGQLWFLNQPGQPRRVFACFPFEQQPARPSSETD